MTDDSTPIPSQTVNITSGTIPSAGSCGGCGAQTGTGFGVWGDVDWCEGVLLKFMSRSDAEGAIVEASLRDYGVDPDEILEMGFGVRLCLDCAHGSNLMVRPFTEGEGVFMYPQPGTLPPGGLSSLS